MLSPDERSAAEAPRTVLVGVTQRLDVDSIGAQDGWLRRLARGLVGDEHEADDLVQETLLVALEKAPIDVGEPRSWLAGVMRHRLSTRRRAERRRRDREALSVSEPGRERVGGRPLVREGRSGPALLAARRSEAAAILEELRALPSIYAQVLWLRYYEELGPGAIAERLSVGLRTVTSRLARGQTLLRARLQRRFGKSGGLLAALAPWLAESAGPGAPSASAVQVVLRRAPGPATSAPAPVWAWLTQAWLAPAWFALTAVLLLAVAGLWRPGFGGDRVPDAGVLAGSSTRGELSSARSVLDRQAAPGVSGVRDASREPLASGAPASTAGESPPVAARQVRGRVLDARGEPLAGVEVLLEPDRGLDSQARSESSRRAAAVVSAPDGRFVFELADGESGVLRAGVTSRVWAPLTELAISAQQDSLVAELVCGERWNAAGRVRDALGRPVLDYRVSYRAGAPRAVQLRTSPSSDGARATRVADVHGRFALTGLAWAPGGWLEFDHAAYHPVRLELDGPAGERLELRFEPLASSSLVRGHVRDGQGQAIAGAAVSFAGRVVHSGVDGSFALARYAGLDDDARRVRAVAEGRLPVLVELGDGGAAAGREPLDMRLDAAALSIAGRVVDARGAAVPRATVWIADPTALGERAADGWSEALAAGAQPTQLVRAETDAQGRFELRGLEARSYRVRAAGPRSLAIAQWELAAGTQTAELALEPTRGVAVAGRVTSAGCGPGGVGGRPASGCEVFAFRFATDVQLADGRCWTPPLEGPRCATDSDGRFDLGALPLEDLVVAVRDRAGRETWVALPATDPGALEIELQPLALVRVACLAPDDLRAACRASGDEHALRFRFWSGEQPVRVFCRATDGSPDRSSSSHVEALFGQCSEVLFVHGRPDRLELLCGDRVLRELPVDLCQPALNLFEF